MHSLRWQCILAKFCWLPWSLAFTQLKTDLLLLQFHQIQHPLIMVVHYVFVHGSLIAAALSCEIYIEYRISSRQFLHRFGKQRGIGNVCPSVCHICLLIFPKKVSAAHWLEKELDFYKRRHLRGSVQQYAGCTEDTEHCCGRDSDNLTLSHQYKRTSHGNLHGEWPLCSDGSEAT